MAKLYGEIAAKALLTLDKSFARANGQPLDASEVYYSLAAAKEYAATAQAYIGQKIVVIENGIVSHYSVEDTTGNLKELGAKPVADGTTVSIGTDGKITLANITETEQTGTYNAVLVNGALTWVKPSSTTVEGLSDLITALTGRVDTAEADIDALQEAVGVAAKDAVGEEGSEGYEPAVAATGLHKAVADEIARAVAAEKALGERIDGIDYVDETELTTALEPYAKSADVVANGTYATDKKALEDSIATKVDAETYATDKKAIDDEAAAIREIAEGARDSLNTFLTSEEIDETVNTLKEIQAEIDKMTDATELATALASKADTTYVDEELGKKQDTIPENTYDAYGSAATAKSEAISDAEGKIATAKQEAIDAAATAAAGIYATQTALGELETAVDERLDVLETYDHATYATKDELTQHGTAADAKYATKEELTPVKQTADNAAAKVETLEDKIEEITSVGGEPNVIDYVKVNGTILEVEKDAEGKSTKTVNVIVPTKVSDLTDDTGFDARITAAQNQADKGVNDASAAQATANEAKTAASENATAIGELNTTVASHTETISNHSTRITALEDADTAHKAEYEALSGIVSGHTESIAKKADTTALDAVSAKAAANEVAIATINDTTLPALNTEIQGKIDAKANSTDVYTKTEVGTITEGKTLVDMINDAKTSATYDDTQVKADIKANADAIAVLNGDAQKEGSVDYKVAQEVAKILNDNDSSDIDTLNEIAAWITNDTTGAAKMNADIVANKAAIDKLNGTAETDGSVLSMIAANAPKIATVDIAGIVLSSTAENKISVAADGTMEVNSLNVNKLVQTTGEELILNGGSANV